MSDNPQQQIDDLKQRIEVLELANNNPNWSFETDFSGLVETVSTDPSTTKNIPKSPFDQIKIYKNGSTWKLAIYDYQTHIWKSVTIA